jgi:hypothetical protein
MMPIAARIANPANFYRLSFQSGGGRDHFTPISWTYRIGISTMTVHTGREYFTEQDRGQRISRETGRNQQADE